MNIITLFDLQVSCPASILALTPGTETIFSVMPPFVTHQITLPHAPPLIISFPHPSLPLLMFGGLVHQYICHLLAIHFPSIPLYLISISLSMKEICAGKASCAGIKTCMCKDMLIMTLSAAYFIFFPKERRLSASHVQALNLPDIS